MSFDPEATKGLRTSRAAAVPSGWSHAPKAAPPPNPQLRKQAGVVSLLPAKLSGNSRSQYQLVSKVPLTFRAFC